MFNPVFSFFNPGIFRIVIGIVWMELMHKLIPHMTAHASMAQAFRRAIRKCAVSHERRTVEYFLVALGTMDHDIAFRNFFSMLSSLWILSCRISIAFTG